MNNRTPSVLFVCVHNAGRSQMAAGLLQHMAGDRIEVRSAGTAPRDQINPAAAARLHSRGGEWDEGNRPASVQRGPDAR